MRWMKILVLLGLVAVCGGENTPCVSEHFCDDLNARPLPAMNVTLNGFYQVLGTQLISGYILVDATHIALISFHDIFALLLLFVLVFNWFVFKRGKAPYHKLMGRFGILVCLPLSIIPAIYISCIYRPLYENHHTNNFFNALLIPVIGVYGLSMLVVGAQGMVMTWKSKSWGLSFAYVLLFLHTVNLVGVICAYSVIFKVLGDSTVVHDSKEWKICMEMSLTLPAFLIWEPFDMYVLIKYLRTSHSYLGDYGAAGLASLPAVSHHKANMYFFTAMSVFAPTLFFFHDTRYIWTEANGFGPHGLSWAWRWAGLMTPATIVLLLGLKDLYQHLATTYGFSNSKLAALEDNPLAYEMDAKPME